MSAQARLDPQQAALLAEIIAAPDDDAVRLVYADWLEDRGDEQAELIRIQIEQERIPAHEDRWWELEDRSVELQRKLRPRLLKQLPHLKGIHWKGKSAEAGGQYLFRRGFLESAEAKDVPALIAAYEVLATGTLVREVRITKATSASLRSLYASPWMPRLRGLSLDHARLGGAPVELLCRHDKLRLRHLDVEENRLGNDGLKAIVRAPSMAELESLVLDHNDLTGKSLEHLSRWSGLPALKVLSLRRNDSLGDSLTEFLRAAPLDHLHQLSLDGCQATANTLQALAKSRQIKLLTRLDLSHHPRLRDAAFSSLLASPKLAALRRLDLAYTGVGDITTLTIAQSSHLSNLRELYLQGTRITSRGVRALMESPYLHLRRLNLSRIPQLDDRALKLSKQLAKRLAGSPVLAAVAYLNLGGVTLDEASEQMLSERFGDALELSPFR